MQCLAKDSFSSIGSITIHVGTVEVVDPEVIRPADTTAAVPWEVAVPYVNQLPRPISLSISPLRPILRYSMYRPPCVAGC